MRAPLLPAGSAAVGIGGGRFGLWPVCGSDAMPVTPQQTQESPQIRSMGWDDKIRECVFREGGRSPLERDFASAKYFGEDCDREWLPSRDQICSILDRAICSAYDRQSLAVEILHVSRHRRLLGSGKF